MTTTLGTGQSACCGGASSDAPPSEGRAIPGAREGGTRAVDSDLSWCDRLGIVRMRLGMGRYRYAVEPGLYAAGHPDGASPVLVTANYKMTFDLVCRGKSVV